MLCYILVVWHKMFRVYEYLNSLNEGAPFISRLVIWEGVADMVDLYTIGYSPFDVHQMIGVLFDYGINLVIDVRSSPYSAYYPNYNKEPLERFLKKKSIHYRNYAQEFGAQQTEKKFFAATGYLDFELFTKSENFLQGFKKVQVIIDKKYTIALMCAEKDPAECHRSIMITRVFSREGFSIKHILSDKSYETQDSIEQRLLDKYFPVPSRNQTTLFEGFKSDAELIVEAYRRRNTEIGFKYEEEISGHLSTICH